MSSPIFKRVRGIAADVLKLPQDSITVQSSAESIESWDSVNHLNFILALEQEFGLQFEPEEIDEMSNIGRILAVLENRLNHGSG